MINKQRYAEEPTFFDDRNKAELAERFVNSTGGHTKQFDDRPSLDDKVVGVKLYNKGKNSNSVGDYHILSNLSLEQERLKISYDGNTKDAETKKTSNQVNLDLSERAKRRESLKAVRKQERPMPMRSELVDNYFKSVMTDSPGGDHEDVFKEMYKSVIDNRIFNNLK